VNAVEWLTANAVAGENITNDGDNGGHGEEV